MSIQELKDAAQVSFGEANLPQNHLIHHLRRSDYLEHVDDEWGLSAKGVQFINDMVEAIIEQDRLEKEEAAKRLIEAQLNEAEQIRKGIWGDSNGTVIKKIKCILCNEVQEIQAPKYGDLNVKKEDHPCPVCGFSKAELLDQEHLVKVDHEKTARSYWGPY